MSYYFRFAYVSCFSPLYSRGPLLVLSLFLSERQSARASKGILVVARKDSRKKGHKRRTVGPEMERTKQRPRRRRDMRRRTVSSVTVISSVANHNMLLLTCRVISPKYVSAFIDKAIGRVAAAKNARESISRACATLHRIRERGSPFPREKLKAKRWRGLRRTRWGPACHRSATSLAAYRTFQSTENPAGKMRETTS